MKREQNRPPIKGNPHLLSETTQIKRCLLTCRSSPTNFLPPQKWTDISVSSWYLLILDYTHKSLHWLPSLHSSRKCQIPSAAETMGTLWLFLNRLSCGFCKYLALNWAEYSKYSRTLTARPAIWINTASDVKISTFIHRIPQTHSSLTRHTCSDTSNICLEVTHTQVISFHLCIMFIAPYRFCSLSSLSGACCHVNCSTSRMEAISHYTLNL